MGSFKEAYTRIAVPPVLMLGLGQLMSWHSQAFFVGVIIGTLLNVLKEWRDYHSIEK